MLRATLKSARETELNTMDLCGKLGRAQYIYSERGMFLFRFFTTAKLYTHTHTPKATFVLEHSQFTVSRTSLSPKWVTMVLNKKTQIK